MPRLNPGDPFRRAGPRIWFQVVRERKAVKNRLHLDISVGGGRAVPIETRRRAAWPVSAP
jgi:hypothetical protein